MIGDASNCARSTSVPIALGALLLSSVAGATLAAAANVTRGPFIFVCKGSPPTKLIVTFVGKDSDRVKLVYKGQTVIARQALSADGGRYQAPAVEFWNKGDDATVDWRGAKLSCSTKK